MNNQKVDLEAIRGKLAGATGRTFWRSLEEVAETKEFEAFIHREFPQQASEWLDPMSRRSFLQLMGASLALGGLTACASGPPEKIVPYVKQPEEIVPGKPLFYATAMPFDGYALGVLVESHQGRPTKIEGNPKHPASLGSTNLFAQATILDLYDPDRSQTVLNLGRPSTWDAFTNDLSLQLQGQRSKQGSGLRILTETVTSPTLAAQIQDLLTQFPRARWHQYESSWRDGPRAGSQAAFGQPVNTVYRFEQADVILSLDADFLFYMPGSVRYARKFIDKRRIQVNGRTMNRLYVVESTPTVTGAMADHRLPMRASHVDGFARALAQGLGVGGVSGATAPEGVPETWLPALVKDLQAHRGRSIVVAGEEQPASVHVLAHAMNAALGNVGQTVIYTDPVVAQPADQTAEIRELIQAMNGRQVDVLVIVGGNPAYSVPAELGFADALQKLPMRIHLGHHVNETAELCQWHIPETHFLETWSDTRAFDGTASIIQPLIQPLYPASRSAHEVISALVGQPGRAVFEIVQDYWGQQPAFQGNFERQWRRALYDGVIAGTALPQRNVTLNAGAIGSVPAQEPATGEALEVNFRPDPTIWDGRFANNGWLQELPKPITLLSWDNAALIGPGTAERLGLQNEDIVALRVGDNTINAPVWITPGHANNSVTVYLGHGRRRAGQVGTNTGFDANQIRPAATPWTATGVELTKTGGTYELVSVQGHFNMEGRELVKVENLAGGEAHAAEEGQEHAAEDTERHGEEEHHEPYSLYPEWEYDDYKWGMAIDLNACIGCNACTIACQAENNIPIVGKPQVGNSREMHWLKVDRYYEGQLDNPATVFQPRPCMHCEKAPCEVVCPVAATVHSSEGLNQMVYNRCVGTRYCSNNCPYKVRRFNFLQWSDKDVPVIELMHNPDVTVRDRGVMEKCTYCVQRINNGRIQAEREDRRIADGEVRTACQQVCPTSAIVFGDINDQNSAVAKLKADATSYALLAELGTQPRTTYNSRWRNPNPEIGV